MKTIAIAKITQNLIVGILQSQIKGNVKHQIKIGLDKFVRDIIYDNVEKNIIPQPVIEIGNLSYYHSPLEMEGGHVFSPEEHYIDDYKLKFGGYLPGSDYRYDFFLKKYCDIDWNTLSKSDKSKIQHFISSAWGSGKWIDDVFFSIEVEGDEFTNQIQGKALFSVEVKKDTFTFEIKNAVITNDTIKDILNDYAEKKQEEEKDYFDIPDEDWD